MAEQLVAHALAVDIGTGGYEVAVRSRDGREALASVDISEATTWRGQKAFDLNPLPERLLTAIRRLQDDGWTFQPAAGAGLSFSVRQHDLVAARDDGSLLVDGMALGWQCNAAAREVQDLRELGVESLVGRIEPRFILPKLRWLLHADHELKSEIEHVMTTGDYIAWRLTGSRMLSSSDALSNGLLIQSSKHLAADVLRAAELNPDWFPQVVQSGETVGTVAPPNGPDDAWNHLREILVGWKVVAGLGDNHATAVGCGLSEEETMVVSAGNSGTVNRMCSPGAPLVGAAARFEYYHERLLLMMLADCAVWYDRFVQQFGNGKSYGELNGLALKADVSGIRRVTQETRVTGWTETYPPDWDALPLDQKAASTQFSIALELMLLVKAMLREVKGAEDAVAKFVLTGGLSQSPFFQHTFVAGLGLLVDGPSVLLSDRHGPLAYQTAAYGALINAMLPQHGGTLKEIIAELCPLKPCAQPDTTRKQQLAAQLQKCGLDA